MPQIAAAVVVAISYVGSATAAVVAGTATLAQIATVAAVGIGAGVGSMAAAKALTPEIGSQGAAVRWEANPDAPLRFAFGRVGVKGNIVDAAIYGPDRMYVSFACSVSAAGPIKRFVSFRAGDYYMSFDGAGAAVNEPYRGEMWLSTRLGAQPDTALTLPSGLKNGSSFPGWNAGRKMSGSAGYLVTLGENSKRSAYEGKIPAFITTIEGLFCYDPRQDSTYPGGAGSCRLSDPATWVWTQNPVLFALKWALGLWEGPTGKGAPQVDYQVGGIGAKVESIRLTTVVEAANIADANGWTSAAWPSTDDDKAQVLDGFLKAAGARYAEIAGQIAFIHRAAPRAPVFTVRARDTAGPVEIDTASSKLNRFNTVRPRFWSEANEWEMTALPEVTATEWQIEDGQGVAVKRTRGADYTFVVDPKQTRELASLEISNSREGIRGRVPLRPYMDPEPGNTFVFDEPDFALSNLKCFVLDVEDDTENDTVVVTFETETDGKYPYAYGQTGSPPPAQELDPRDPFHVDAPLPGDWTITPRPPAPGGGQLPGFDLGGTVSNDTATAIIVETGPSATGPWTQAYQGPPTVTNIPIDGLQPGATYFIAIQYQRNQNYSDRHVYGPFTAPVLDPGPNAPTILQQRADIDALADLQASETVIRQEQIDILTARSNQAANLIDNPSGAADPAGSSSIRSWIKEGGPNVQLINDQEVGRIFVVGDYMVSQVYPASPGQKHSLGYNASPVGGGHVRLQYITSSGAVEGVRVDNTLDEKAERRRSVAPSVAPAGTTGFRLITAPPSGGVLPVWAIKVNFGDTATDFTDDYSANVLQAEASITKTLVLDLESQNALARLSLVAAASGSIPARIGLTSSTLGSAITFDAPYIYWGANTVFEDDSDTLVTVVGDRVRVLAFGAPFGANGDLLEWWGPSGIAMGAMTTANGLNGRMTTLPYVFDNVVNNQASALRSSIAVNSAAGTTNDSNWTVWGTATYSNLPSGGMLKLFADITPNAGMTIEGGLGSFNGEWRVRQGSSTIASGTFTASVGGGDADIALAMPAAPVAPAGTGPASLTLEVRRASGTTYIGGAGAHVTFYTEWTKTG